MRARVCRLRILNLPASIRRQVDVLNSDQQEAFLSMHNIHADDMKTVWGQVQEDKFSVIYSSYSIGILISVNVVDFTQF